MIKKLFLIAFVLSASGCADVKTFLTKDRSGTPEEKHASMINRVVYTPLIPSRKPTNPQTMEVLLRPPKREYKELGLISMYREFSNETAANLLPYMREKAAMEGADAILLVVADEVPVGVRSSASAVPIGDVIVANAYSTMLKEGQLRGAAIVYE